MRLRLFPLIALLALVTAAPVAAAPPFVYRSMVLRNGDVALDFGMGMGHEPRPAPVNSINAFGLNLQLAVGLARDVELGVRTGFRLDDNRLYQRIQADAYGRLFETETYGTGGDRIANPEIYALWSMARGAHAELGLRLAAYLPFEDPGPRFGMLFALPVALRGGSLRLDTGVYVPVFFHSSQITISVPAHLWIQASSRLWLGPLFGLRVTTADGRSSYVEYPLGFGLGSALNSTVDLRGWLLFPNMNQGSAARTFGVGFSLQFRFE